MTATHSNETRKSCLGQNISNWNFFYVSGAKVLEAFDCLAGVNIMSVLRDLVISFADSVQFTSFVRFDKADLFVVRSD